MQKRTQTSAQLLREKLVIIIRLTQVDDADAITDALAAGGAKAIEITSNTPNYTTKIGQLKERYPSLLIGAGTITSAQLVDEAVAAGAEFIVTPNTNEEIVTRAHELDVPVVMGAFSPSDIVNATRYGADIIKLFPSGELGPGYLKSLSKGPFIGTPFFAVGGVSDKNACSWMEAGACGVGVGGQLAAPVPTPEAAAELTARVAKLVSDLGDYPAFQVTP